MGNHKKRLAAPHEIVISAAVFLAYNLMMS